jgi:predicted RNA-binding Zn ribbon-like protein
VAVHFGSYMDATVQLAVDLVNGLTHGWARGRQVEAPDGDERRRAVADAFADRPNRARQWAAQHETELDRLSVQAGELRRVFDQIERADTDAAARHLNGLMRRHDARPELSAHDGQPWHLHFHESAADPTGGLVAGCATALAMVVASDDSTRLGVCQAEHCDRVYVDTSRNASRRFCSTACQNRTKAAAFRRRRASDAS